MGYVTFYARGDRWQLCDGIGEGQAVLGERVAPPRLVDVSLAAEPVMWVCSSPEAGRWVVERVRIPDLSVSRSLDIAWRVDAVASSPEGSRVALLRGDQESGPSLWLGPDPDWSRLPAPVSPDLSSRLAWIDDGRIAFESSARRLCVVEVGSGEVKEGPPGHWPSAAPRSEHWFAISGGHAVAFPLSTRDLSRHVPLRGFDLVRPTSLQASADGQVLTWTEPRFWFGTKTYLQRRGQRRVRLIEGGLVIVAGPYEL